MVLDARLLIFGVIILLYTLLVASLAKQIFQTDTVWERTTALQTEVDPLIRRCLAQDRRAEVSYINDTWRIKCREHPKII